MFAARQLRVRVLEAIDSAIKQFRRREDLWPLRVPHEPILLADLLARARTDDGPTFDPAALRSRLLLQLEWEDGSRWETWVSILPSGFKAYFDAIEEETRLLASGGRNEGDESDRVFLQLLAESAGGHFGIEMSGGAPVRVRTALDDREFLVDLFVELFEVTGTEDSVRRQLPDADGRPGPGTDFRADVERWLERAIGRKRSTA